MTRRLGLLVLLTLAALVGLERAALAGSGPRSGKLDLVLRAAATRPPEPQRVIVRTQPGRRAPLRAALLAHGDVIEAEHPALDALTAYVHGEDLLALDADPSVLSVSCDCEVRAPRGPRSAKRTLRAAGPGSRDLSASELRQVLGLPPDATGAGVGVAVVDSGIDPSADFGDRILRFWDYTRGGRQTAPVDEYGHGTHVAGLIASSGLLSDGRYQGVAPGASLYGFRVLDRHGRGRTSTVIRALEYIAANHDNPRVFPVPLRVVNLSLGHPIFEPAASDPLVQAVEALVAEGLVVVVSAGNRGQNPETGEVGYGGIESPGNAPSALTAGAADTHHTVARLDDVVALWSSRGPTWYDGLAKPDVVAPGVALVSNAPRRATLYQEYPELRVDANYGRLSGTSMAAAVTSGVAALLLAANRDFVGGFALTPNAVKAIVEYTATPLTDPTTGEAYDALTQGTGEVNGEGAVRLAASVDPRVGVGQAWTGGVQEFSKFGKVRVAWARNIVWGNYVVGDDIALIHSLAWDENIVWGTAIARDGDNIVWGLFVGELSGYDNIVWGSVRFDRTEDNIVWGSVAEWADNIVWGSGYLGYTDGENIVWGSTEGSDNIVWGTVTEDNIVWGNLVAPADDNIVWGSDGDSIVWGSARGGENIVWGAARSDEENIVSGNAVGAPQPPQQARKNGGR